MEKQDMTVAQQLELLNGLKVHDTDTDDEYCWQVVVKNTPEHQVAIKQLGIEPEVVYCDDLDECYLEISAMAVALGAKWWDGSRFTVDEPAEGGLKLEVE